MTLGLGGLVAFAVPASAATPGSRCTFGEEVTGIGFPIVVEGTVTDDGQSCAPVETDIITAAVARGSEIDVDLGGFNTAFTVSCPS